MPWWAWLVLGIGLLGVEMFVIDAQFYLVFIGLSAAVVGLLGLAGVNLPEWAQWLVFAVLALIAMLTFRRRVYEMLRSGVGQVDERLTVGDRVLVAARLEPGAERTRRIPGLELDRAQHRRGGDRGWPRGRHRTAWMA